MTANYANPVATLLATGSLVGFGVAYAGHPVLGGGIAGLTLSVAALFFALSGVEVRW